MYNQYGNNYESSIEKLNECMKNPAFAAAVERCNESHELGNKIEALLIAPIQRIPRYLLLLRVRLTSLDFLVFSLPSPPLSPLPTPLSSFLSLLSSHHCSLLSGLFILRLPASC